MKCLRGHRLSDQNVWDIVARWQGLKTLFDLYRHPPTHQLYRQSQPCDLHDYEMPPAEIMQPRLFQELRSLPTNHECVSNPDTTTADRETIYPYFYKALIRYWLICEAMRLAKICYYQLQSEENKTWEEIDYLISNSMSLWEAAHVLEVYDFVYDFLMRQLQCSQIENFSQWVDGRQQFWPNHTRESRWITFVHELRVTLCPADVIELLNWTFLWQQYPFENSLWTSEQKTAYLRQRLLFNPAFPGQVGFKDSRVSPDTSFTSRDLEDSVYAALRKHETPPGRAWHKVWDHYRRTKWQTDARGRILLWGQSDEMLIEKVIL